MAASRGAVEGFVGLRLTLVDAGLPVAWTRLGEEPLRTAVRTSLRIAFPPSDGSDRDGPELVVWSSVAGSLAGLADDLAETWARLLGPCAGSEGLRTVVLDADPLPPGAVSGVEGLDEAATVHRAAGLLVGRGADEATVYQVLADQASGAGSSVPAWAARLLEGVDG